MISQAKSLASAVIAMLVFATPGWPAGKCSFQAHIKNDSSITMHFKELKSALTFIFESQWSGSRVIEPGKTGLINWTSDFSCTDMYGHDRTWNIKLIRDNGNVHYCGGIHSGEQYLEVNTPDICFVY